MVLRDEQAPTRVFEILFDPSIGKLFHDDEQHFLDRPSVGLVICDTRSERRATPNLKEAFDGRG